MTKTLYNLTEREAEDLWFAGKLSYKELTVIVEHNTDKAEDRAIFNALREIANSSPTFLLG